VKRPSIAIVGAGRAGSSLTLQLHSHGYRITEIIARDKSSLPRTRRLAGAVNGRAATSRTARLDADIVWFCVPDSQISVAAHALARLSWKRKIALHSSGGLTSDALRVLREFGAAVASAHPLMTFVSNSAPELANVAFAIEGDRAAAHAATRIVRMLGGKPITIRPRDKAAYHAFATMICPLLVTLLAVSEKAAVLAGMSATESRRRMLPIVRQTLANYEKLGAAKAFTGPIVRGDAETIRLHLKALAKAPMARNVYVGLASAALECLPSQRTAELRRILDGVIPGSVRRNETGRGRVKARATRRG
jgi:predicted short-subunit dehydrogenase-like oxidoreductase (DUF2520 family)